MNSAGWMLSVTAGLVVIIGGCFWICGAYSAYRARKRGVPVIRPVYVTTNGKTRGPFETESKAITEGLKDL